MLPRTGTTPDRRSWIALLALLVVALITRSIRLGQPIVENYVGRQVPTAMVARNLERGSGFLNPQIDVAPLPNRFLVEPPVYAALVVGLRRVAPLGLEPAGRLVSAVGIMIGAWGLFGLVARREGADAGLVAVAVFIAFPVTIRYGRAFQPDAFMLGAILLGLRGWDEFEHGGGFGRLVVGVIATGLGLALKVIAAGVLVALVMTVLRDRKPWKVALAACTLIPAGVWYVYAASLVADGAGSLASADNGAVWLNVLRAGALLRVETYRNVGRFLLVRAFTPIGPPLALLGLFAFRRPGDSIWRVWGGCALLTLAGLAAKLHHEYYWLLVAPVAAVGVARVFTALNDQGRRGRILCLSVATVFFGLAAVFSVSTWQTPAEWRNLETARRGILRHVRQDALLIAPEALLFAADRRGCRLEFTAPAARRAAGEWGVSHDVDSAESLVAFYADHGARYFADVCAGENGPERLALRAWVRDRYNVLMDTSEVFLAEISAPRDGARTSDGAAHGTGRAVENSREAR